MEYEEDSRERLLSHINWLTETIDDCDRKIEAMGSDIERLCSERDDFMRQRNGCMVEKNELLDVYDEQVRQFG